MVWDALRWVPGALGKNERHFYNKSRRDLAGAPDTCLQRRKSA